uniref:Uncharacterized protein n=1 Tax=Meloidogyne javanica TaxID=6303 RepID=A0A915MT05_MELJA
MYENERKNSIRVVNSILEKRKLQDEAEEKPFVIPKKKSFLPEKTFYGARVEVLGPAEPRDKALTMMKMTKEKLVKLCSTDSPVNPRGIHSKEANLLQKIKSL